ncbi:unnamed protein product [Kuraishia capsulata CBS 1993]|uniref:PX domain-containing protein n=1 Tax=Kuraishia capsulata CBS 1993 TaxID=1382522 RepID=W6MLE4_9ASCO|nr:uncharacterized protein KUCA_T00003302001 [Kuraishia capsulata CBS 1993]CDK27324.1 unnamed protein product [Kuraishia capsulata CBS 1993]
MNFSDEDDNNPFSESHYFYSSGIEAEFEGYSDGRDGDLYSRHTSSSGQAPCLDSEDEPDWVAASHPDRSESDDESIVNGTAFLGEHTMHTPAGIAGKDGLRVEIVGAEASRDYKASLTIFYNIQIDGDFTKIVKRRYSDFCSFRFCLLRLFPTKVIPPIPEKHSLGKLIKHPLSYKTDSKVISSRIRLLHNFLDTLLRDEQMGDSSALKKFLDPEEKNWTQTLKSPPFTLVPNHPLLFSPQTPTQPNPYHSYLPIPPISSLKGFDSRLNSSVFRPMELRFQDLARCLLGLEKCAKRIENDMTSYCKKMTDLGGHYNVVSLLEPNVHPNPLEVFGQGIDSNFINLEILIKNFRVNFKEPIKELRATCTIVLHLLGFRKWKDLQLNYLRTVIVKKQFRTKKLLEMETLDIRLDLALSQRVLDSPTITEALRRFEEHRVTPGETPRSEPGSRDSNWKSLFSGSKREINSLTSQERQREINGNRLDLAKLTKCFELLNDDVRYISIEVEKNVLLEERRIKKKIFYMLADFQKMLLIYSSENMNVWKDKAAIGHVV